MAEEKSLKEKLRCLLDAERFDHSLSVSKTAVRLARIHGADIKKATIAGLLHDCAKSLSPGELLKTAKKEKLRLDSFVLQNPKLLHDKVSAVIARKHFGIKDREVLSAIGHHTAGKENMTKLEKIIYLADHIEPGRKQHHVKKIRGAAKKNMEKAIALVAGEMIQYLLKNNLPVYCRTVITRNYYLK
ncbi:MAG: bis(5'-nucleosyl)-tetraphosphatase (symmetrical) YqeK [Candidatus Saganbacteria bacterium]|nr:bis(5'-nucleosyl)-tetraphosphatase (symmetrical) YqeK [Candidatus Saganbacteria bacterium]